MPVFLKTAAFACSFVLRGAGVRSTAGVFFSPPRITCSQRSGVCGRRQNRICSPRSHTNCAFIGVCATRRSIAPSVRLACTPRSATV